MGDFIRDEQVRQDAPENLRPFPAPARQSKVQSDLVQLINRLNRFNFKQEPIHVHLRHKLHDNLLIRTAIPQPCLDEELECRWVEADEGEDIRLRGYRLERFVLADGREAIQFEPQLVSIDSQQITVRLPAVFQELPPRSVRRCKCDGIGVKIVANGALYQGRLLDFSAGTFRVELEAAPPQSFDWISAQLPVNATLHDNQGIIYVGDCRIIRQSGGGDHRDYVLQPTRTQLPRFRPRECRSIRQELLPNPNVVFTHPITHRSMTMKLIDISGTGFAVSEPITEAVLLPGMILKEMAITLTARARIKCTVQVVHRTPVPGTENVKVGLTLLDIDSLDHMDLVSLLQQARDPEVYVSNHVDMDALWDFFFEAGFISPEKYAAMVGNLERFKESYAKLYTDHPSIARHFIHMEQGKILGHFAMLRLFEKTWVNHHHAAVPNKRKSGLLVLDRLSEYINDTHILHSAQIRFTAGYYRTGNKFPMSVFGGFAKRVNNPKVYSIDDFASLTFQGLPTSGEWDDSGRWELGRIRRGDLEDLQGFYEKVSGGLMLEAIDMTPESIDRDTLSAEYARAGFRREIHHMAIRKNGELKAVVAVNCTDIGLNFSELTNATQLFVVDSNGFGKRDFELMMSLVAVKFGLGRIPLLVYPCDYLTKAGIPSDRNYSFDVMNLDYWDDYMNYLREFMRKAKVR